MDIVLHWLLAIDLLCLVFFGFRSLYWGWKFMNTIWIEDPDKAREYGIPPEGLSGSVEMGAAVWSKDPCADPKLERLRQRARKTGAQTMICLILIPLIVLGYIIPSAVNAEIDFRLLVKNASAELLLVAAGALCVFAISIIAMVCVTRSRRAARERFRESKTATPGNGCEHKEG